MESLQDFGGLATVADRRYITRQTSSYAKVLPPSLRNYCGQVEGQAHYALNTQYRKYAQYTH